jgi:proteasome lid subunit RPN8/RPN11
MPFLLRIPRKHYDAIVAQAQAELPNECCGLLAGRIVTDNALEPESPNAQRGLRRIGQVIERYPLANAAASPVEYLSESRSMHLAVQDMDRRGLDILAIYHSHPTSEPVPSKKDLALNYSEDVVNLIISLTKEEPEVRGWWLTKSAFFEAAWDYGAIPLNIQIVVHCLSTQEPVYIKRCWDYGGEER